MVHWQDGEIMWRPFYCMYVLVYQHFEPDIYTVKSLYDRFTALEMYVLLSMIKTQELLKYMLKGGQKDHCSK